ncbi:MAG: MipA/OmpV family protein [Roseococcus sp.]
MTPRLRAGLALLCLLAGPARAVEVATPREGLQLDLGAGPLLYPAYPGARIYRALPFPVISGGYGPRVNFDVLDGLRITALEAAGFSLGPALRLRFGRRTADDRAQLHGLRSFPDTVEAGGFVAYERGFFYADATLTQDVAQAHQGLALELRGLISLPMGPVGVEFGPELRVVDRRFAQSFFGIDPQNALASGRPAYRASAGLERVGGIVSAEYRINPSLSLRGFVEWARLEGSAARSPLVQSGAVGQVYAGIFLVWRAW